MCGRGQVRPVEVLPVSLMALLSMLRCAQSWQEEVLSVLIFGPGYFKQGLEEKE